MARILLIGSNGNLGSALLYPLTQNPQHQVTCLTRQQINLQTQLHQLPALLQEAAPEIIINAAAFTHVDNAESEPEALEALNVQLPKLLAEYSAHHKGYLIHFGTDYVFDGSGLKPYTPMDWTTPINAYGKSKLDGEHAVLANAPNHAVVLRVSWLFGDKPNGFTYFVASQLQQKQPVKAVTDQWGSPTYTYDVANHVMPQVLTERPTGILHANNTGHTSRLEQAQFIAQTLKADETLITPAATTEFFTTATRPHYTCLEPSFSTMPHWQDATQRYIQLFQQQTALTH